MYPRVYEVQDIYYVIVYRMVAWFTKKIYHVAKQVIPGWNKEKTGIHSELHSATSEGRLDIIKYLISKKNADPYEKYDKKNTLHFAAEFGQLQVVRYLTEQIHMDPTVKDDKNRGNALHWATARGHMEVVKHLVKEMHMDPAEKDDGIYKRNSLHLAALHGHLDVMKYFINELSMCPSERDGGIYQRNTLHIAASHGHLDVMKYLINEQNMCPSEKDVGEDKMNALQRAAARGHFDVVKYLIDELHADPSEKDEGTYKRNALHWAVAKGKSEVVKYLIDQVHMDPYEKDDGDYKRNALNTAAAEGHLEVVKFLIGEVHMDPSIKDEGDYKMNTLHLAAARGRLKIVQYLIDELHMEPSVTDDSDDKMNTLQCAAECGQLRVVRYLVDQIHMDASERDEGKNKMNALQRAASDGHLGVVKYLIEEVGVLASARDKGVNHGNALHWATARGQLETVRYLVDQLHMDPSETDGGVQKCNTLHIASANNHLAVVKYLIDKKNMNTLERDAGKTRGNALHWACIFCCVDVIDYLIHVVDMDPSDTCTENGDSAFHCIFRTGSPAESKYASSKLLLEKSSNINVKNKEGQTPLDIALLKKNMHIALLLIENGADVDQVHQSLPAQLVLEGKLSQNIVEQSGQFLDFPNEADYETADIIKAVVLGDVKAGKTSIIKSLLHKETCLVEDGEEGRTVGVDVSEVTINEDTTLIVYDFGGHESYFYTHQIFVSSQTLYLIVIDSSTFLPTDLHRSLSHWFNSVSKRGVKPVFLIICSKVDLHTKEKLSLIGKQILDHLNMLLLKENVSLQEHLNAAEEELVSNPENEDYLKEHIKRIKLLLDNRPVLPEEVIFVTVKEEQSLKHLENIISETIVRNADKLPPKKIPRHWITSLEKINFQSDYIKMTDFKESCTEEKALDGSEQNALLQYLCNIGRVLHYGDSSVEMGTYNMITSDMESRKQASHRSKLQHDHDLSNILFTNPTWVSRILGSIHHHSLQSANPLEFMLRCPAFGKKTEHEIKAINEHLMNGVMSLDTVHALLSGTVEEAMVATILELFQKLDVCYEIKPNEYSYDIVDASYCFPALLRDDCHDNDSIWQLNRPANMDEFHIVVSNNTSISPSGFFQKVSVRINELLCNRINWKTKMVANLGERNAVIKLEMKDGSLWLGLRVLEGDREYGRAVLLWIISTIRYVTLHYPSILFSFYVVCAKCVAAATKDKYSAIQTWPMEKFTSSNARNVILRCTGNTHHSISLQDIFPVADEANLCDQEVSKSIGQDWKYLFRHLCLAKLPQADAMIDDLICTGCSFYEKVGKIMKFWRQKCANQATTECLLTSLGKLERNDIIDSIEMKIGTHKQQSMTQFHDGMGVIPTANQQVVTTPDEQDGVEDDPKSSGPFEIKMEDSHELFGRIALTVAPLLGRDCWDLGRCLFDYDTFVSIDGEMRFNERERREISYQILRRWRQKYTKAATYSVLIAALRVMERADIIDLLHDEFGMEPTEATP